MCVCVCTYVYLDIRLVISSYKYFLFSTLLIPQGFTPETVSSRSGGQLSIEKNSKESEEDPGPNCLESSVHESTGSEHKIDSVKDINIICAVGNDVQEPLHCKSYHSEVGLITGEIINSDVSEYTVGTKNEGDDKKEEEEKEEEEKKENEEEKEIKSSMQKKENVEFGLDDKSNMDIGHISNKFNSVNKENDGNFNSCHEGDLDSGILSETADQHSSLPVELQSKNECHILPLLLSFLVSQLYLRYDSNHSLL